MTRLNVNENVAVEYLGSKGRGVIARRDFRRGQLIEVCPLIAVVPHTRAFDHWELAWGHKKVALVGGCAHLYNHGGSKANVRFIRDLANGVIRVKAKRAIRVGEELTIQYLCDLWFEEQK